jgi:hypothetical protein
MTAWVLKNFIGEQPRVSPNLLPPNAAQGASDVRLDDGALTPYRKQVLVSSFSDYPGDYQTIFEWDGTWYGWPSVVNAAQGPVATDRLYITGLPVTATVATSAETTSGDTLTFDAVPAGVVAGLSITDSTNPDAIQDGAIVVSTTSTTVVSSLDVAATVASGDTIKFGGAPQMIVDGTTYGLAVPFPAGALTATVTGSGSGTVITRTYVYTYVTAFGEESEPCPASNLIDMQPGQTVTLTEFVAPPSGRNITTINIYRTQTGDSGTDLYYIDQMAASTSTYADTIPDDQFAEVLPSRDYNAPPDGLAGLVAMPNGMMAAFDSANPKNLYFCEPFLPHAWPEEYVLTTDFDIVGLGALGTSLVILTKGNPYLAQGTDPSSMQMIKILVNLPCVNPRSIVDLGQYIAYASHEGLVLADSLGNANVATQRLYNRTEWQAYAPTTLCAGQVSGRYFASYNTTDVNGVPLIGTLIFDVAEGVPFVIESDIAAVAFYYDISGGALYFLTSNGGIYQFDAPAGVPLSYSWHSKLMILSKPENFSCIVIDSEEGLNADEIAAINAARAAAIAANAALLPFPLGGELAGAPLNQYAVNGDNLEALPPLAKTVSVSVIADGNVVATVNTIGTTERLPSGFMSRKWEVEINGSQRVQQVALATSVAELKAQQAS